MVKINGEPQDAAGQSVAAYLEVAGYDSRAVAVEYNEAILPMWMPSTSLVSKCTSASSAAG